MSLLIIVSMVWLALMLTNAGLAMWRGTTKGHDTVAIWLLVFAIVVVIGCAVQEAIGGKL